MPDHSRVEKKRQEEAARPADKEKLVPKEVNEGNLFGVRAIEHGYYGGVSQTSRPVSPTPSYRLAPDAPIVDWSKGTKGLNSSASSINSYAASTNPAKMKSSPLRLEVGEAAGVGGMGGTYLPPAPSPRSNRAESPMFGEPKPAGWVNPLDVHYSRPTTPQPYRPTSYLPKLNLDFGGSGLLVPSSGEVKSEAASIVGSEVAVAAPSPAVLKSPTTGAFSQLSNVRAAQQSLKSIFPAGNEQGLPSPKGGRFENTPVPLKDLSPTLPSVDPDKFPQDNRRWNPSSPTIRDSVLESRWNKSSPTVDSTPLPPSVRDSVLNEQWGLSAISSIASTPTTLNASPSPRLAGPWAPPPPSPTVPDSILDAEWDRSRPIIRDSVVSKQRVSVHRPIHQRDSNVESLLTREPSRDHLRRSHLSIAASSMYSNDSSILNIDEATSPRLPMHARMQSHQADFDFSHPHSRSQSTSTKAKSITRTRDSNEITRHSRSISDESLIQVGRHNRELQSDSDSKSNLHPRESPFSNSNAASSHSDLHSTRSSFSSYLSSRSTPGQEAPPLPTSIPKAQPTPPNIEVDLNNFPFPAAPAPRPPQGQGFPFREQQIGAPPRSAARPPPPSPRGFAFEIAIPPPPISSDSNNHLSITPGNRGRSASEVSQNSIGEFYDSYFRQSTMAGGIPKAGFGVGNRGSVQDRISGINNRERSGSTGMGMRDRDSRRPAPLNLNQKRQQETIDEIPTPRTGAFGGAPIERFPTRI